jgi:hypothetical protein
MPSSSHKLLKWSRWISPSLVHPQTSALLCHQEAVSPSLCLHGCVLPCSIAENLCPHHFVCLAVSCLALLLRSCVFVTLLAWMCPALLFYQEAVSSSLRSPGCVPPCFVIEKLCLHHFLCLAVSCLALSSRICVFVTLLAWMCPALLCRREAVSPSLSLPGCFLPCFATDNLCLHQFICLAVSCLAVSSRICLSIALFAASRQCWPLYLVQFAQVLRAQ